MGGPFHDCLREAKWEGWGGGEEEGEEEEGGRSIHGKQPNMYFRVAARRGGSRSN